MRIFLIGMLCGVMIAAAFTYAFAIPANNYGWEWKSGTAAARAWTFDKNGPCGLEVDGRTDPGYSRQKPVTLTPSEVNVRSEQL